MIDDRVKQINRSVYTIPDAISATGGFLGLIDILVFFLIGKF